MEKEWTLWNSHLFRDHKTTLGLLPEDLMASFNVKCCWTFRSQTEDLNSPLVPNKLNLNYVVDSFSLSLRHRASFDAGFAGDWTQVGAKMHRGTILLRELVLHAID